MFGIPIEILIILSVIGSFLLISNWKKLPGTSTDLHLGGISGPLKRLGRPLLLAVAVLILFYFWSPIKEGFASWFTNSDANGVIGINEETITTWFWLIILLAALVIYLMTRARRTKSPIRRASLGDTFWGGFGAMIIGTVVIGGVFLAFVVVDAATGGKAQEKFDLIAGTPVYRQDLGCNLRDYIGQNGLTIPAAGAVITICPGDGTVYLMAEHRTDMVGAFDANFFRNNSNVLKYRQMADFFVLQRGGGTVNSFVLQVNDVGFSSSGLSSAKLFIRSVPY